MRCKGCKAHLESAVCSYCRLRSLEFEQMMKSINDQQQKPVQDVEPQRVSNPAPQQMVTPIQTPTRGAGFRVLRFIACMYLGWFGVHHFMVGNNGKGALYFFTFGLFGIGWMFDIFSTFFDIFNPR